ncbi:MAG TPA: DUF5985 family protein [Candidatus Kapabacteria bacterium]|nr:DUF5985 family protein [Candidatus Kapabacteria bacterium]
MATIVYILCALTSSLCAVLLLRRYARSRLRLLLWSGLCFIGLALNALLLIVDTRLMPEVDLSIIRALPAVIGISLLIYGLVWESA